MRVVFVGAGNLATRLSLEMRKSGMSIGQVYSHTSEHAKILADELGCGWTVVPEEIVEDADLYVFSLKDAVLRMKEALTEIVHPSGASLRMSGR